MQALVGARSLDAGRPALRAALWLIDDARGYVTTPLGSSELVCSAVRELLDARGGSGQVAQVLASLSRDLSGVEALGDSRDIHVAWAVWHLGRAVAALDEGSGLMAAARMRDLTHCVFRAMTWEGERSEVAPTLARSVGEHMLARVREAL